MAIYRTYGVITALAPVFHGGDEKTGSTPLLRTIMAYCEDADHHEVPMPHVSGNSIRAKLRRLAMKYMLDTVEYEIKNNNLYHSLYSGGQLKTTEETTGYLDLEFRKRICNLIPLVSLFGGTFGNQMISGKLIVDFMWPVCLERKHDLPDHLKNDPRADQPIRTFTDQGFFTRRDDLRAERQEDEQAVQMKVDYECFIPGTKFYHQFVLQFPNELEISCLGHLLDLFATFPYIGGKTASGNGKVKIEYNPHPDSSAYLQFLTEKKAEIKALLAELEEKV